MVTSLVNEGELIRIHTGNGSAYDEPKQRRCDLVLAALRDAYITQETAKAIYGLGEVNGV